MMPFIRLTRPLNLLIIGITMYGLGWYYDQTLTTSSVGIQSFHFFLLVISTMMIAAAGNIINDYFDVRADRINKPEKLIIGKFVKRRVAIVTHWALNFVAFSIAAYLSWRLDTFWYLFIHLLSINILWYYSSYFKRKFLIGNIMIAGLTAMVPLLVGLYYSHQLQLHPSFAKEAFVYPFNGFHERFLLVFLSFALAIFAFILNFAREIVKDIEDIKGDQLLHAKTVPIVMGVNISKWIAAVVLSISILMTGLISLLFPSMKIMAFLPIYISALFVVFALIYLVAARKNANYKNVNLWIKLAMVSGLLSPVYWKILLYYGS